MVDLGKNNHIVVDGVFVNAKVERVVLAIKEYEPEIDVEWLPVDARKDVNGNDIPAFKVVHRPPDGREFVLFYVKDEDEFDLRVLHRIIANDQRRGTTTLSEYEAWEKAQELVKEQEFQDWLEEQQDVVEHIIKTKLNTYHVSDDLVIKDGIPFNAKKLKD